MKQYKKFHAVKTLGKWGFASDKTQLLGSYVLGLECAWDPRTRLSVPAASLPSPPVVRASTRPIDGLSAKTH